MTSGEFTVAPPVLWTPFSREAGLPRSCVDSTVMVRWCVDFRLPAARSATGLWRGE